MTYTVLIGCTNDKTKKHYKPGELVTDADFEKAVIKDWLEIGVLERAVEVKHGDGQDE